MKFAPTDRTSYSEVVATKFIAKGEECTIPYLIPMEQTKDRRQKELYNQFHFYCQCNLCSMKESEFENIQCECDNKKEICENCNSNEELIKKIEKIEKKLFIIDNLVQSEYFTKSINSLLDLKPLLSKNHILLLRLNKLIGINMNI
jgi:hypothetical protein